MTTLATNLNAGITSDSQVGGRGSSEQRGFLTTLTLISRLEAITLSMIEQEQIHSRVPEWETDSLRAPKINANGGFVTANTQDTSAYTPTQRAVLQNYSQVFVGLVATEGTLRREETNTGDEHEYQVEEKEAIAIGRDMNQSLLHPTGVRAIAGTSNSRLTGGFYAYANNVLNVPSANAGTPSTFAWTPYTATQAASGAAVNYVAGASQADATAGTHQRPTAGTGVLDGTSVPTTTNGSGGSGLIFGAFKRSLLEAALSQVFDAGGRPTNGVMSPGLRSVFTEVIGRGGSSDIYRINVSNMDEVKNTTSVFVTDFGMRLAVDTEQQLKTTYGANPNDMIWFNPQNVKFGAITPITRNDDIPQPLYGAASGLVAEGAFLFYNPNDILIMRNLANDVSNSAYYPNIG